VIRGFAGTTNTPGFAGDTGPPRRRLRHALRTAIAADGSVCVADFNNNRIRRATRAGTSTRSPATAASSAARRARLTPPATSSSPTSGHRILKVDTAGALSAVVGSARPATSGTTVRHVRAAERSDRRRVHRRRRAPHRRPAEQQDRHVAPGPDGVGGGSTITSILGDGRPAFADGAGRAASLLLPTDVEVRADGAVLVADRGNQRVRIATPGTSCPSALPCQSAADCEDSDPCTIDACGSNAVCTHTPLAADQCQASCAAEPGGCLPGGGPRKSDCFAEVLVKGVAGGLRPVARCRDNDDACDFDSNAGAAFRVAVC
jgi:hypothetical protein